MIGSNIILDDVILPYEIKFCQHCGQKLSEKHIENIIRPYCADCNLAIFLNPKVVVVVVVSMDSNLVLIRRGTPPHIGQWSFPGGYVDQGEMLEDAAIREIQEETSLEVEIDDFIGVYSEHNNPIVLVAYSAKVLGGNISPGDDVEGVGVFEFNYLPTLSLPNDYKILEDWQRLHS